MITVEVTPKEWSEDVICSKGHRMNPTKGMSYWCKICKEKCTYDEVRKVRNELLKRAGGRTTLYANLY